MRGGKSPFVTDLVTRQSTDLVAASDPLIAEALSFIRGHGCEPICINDIVERVCVSRSTLEHRFQAVLGKTLHSELQKIRLDTARRLLTSSDLSLQVIAEKSGFSSPHYMSAVFQRKLGYPPGRFRKQARSI